MIAALVFTMPHTKTYKKYAWRIWYLWPIFRILPNRLEKHPMTICFVSRRQLQLPRRPPRILGAEAWRRCNVRLRKAIAPWSSSWSLQRPRWTRPATTAVALEGFWGRFGSVSFLQPDTLSAARETQQGNESTINQRKQEMIWGQRREYQWVVLGVALARWRKGFVHGQVIFSCALGCWVVFVLVV